MKILLFDTYVTGHHISNAEHLGRYLIEKGDAVTLATWTPNAKIDALKERLPTLDIWYISDNGTDTFGTGLVDHYLKMTWALHRAVSFANSRDLDVLHHLDLDSSELPLWLGLLFRKQPRSVFGFAYHHPHEGERAILRRITSGLRRASLRQLLSRGRLNTLFVFSPRVRDAEIRVLGTSVDKDRIVVVPDPVDAPEETSKESARARLDLPEEAAVLLFFGGLRYDKGADILLEALPLVRSNDDWVVVVAGQAESTAESDVERCRAQLSRPERLIARLGFVPDEDVHRYFAAADAVVLPYRPSLQVTSGVLQRAAAAGKPIIASDVGDLGSIVRDRQLGLVVTPESPSELARAIEDFVSRRVELARAAGPNGLAYATSSDWRILGERVRAEYSRACMRAANKTRSN